MPVTRWNTVLVYVLLGIAAVALMAATPCIGMGVLGLVGVLADVSYGENRSMGLQSLRIAAIPLGICIVALVAALLVRRRGRG